MLAAAVWDPKKVGERLEAEAALIGAYVCGQPDPQEWEPPSLERVLKNMSRSGVDVTALRASQIANNQ